VLCRRRAEEGYFPVVPIEDLDALLAQEHEALGHPGYETLWTHVSWQGGRGWEPMESGMLAGKCGCSFPAQALLQLVLSAAPIGALCCPFPQLSKSYQTDLGDAHSITGLAGFTRELVKHWSFQCPTCTYKRNNKPAKNPVTTAIRVREVFELQQVGLSEDLVCACVWCGGAA
jgi:hypothetical protein